eukprot:COSAG04_NODE_91_length_26852_cov_8.609315_26_plen_100_part_00
MEVIWVAFFSRCQRYRCWQGLEARPWWPEQGWPWVAALLSAAPRIRKEFAALRAAAEATAQPGTKGGKWSGLYLINQVRIALAPNYSHVMRSALTMRSA